MQERVKGYAIVEELKVRSFYAKKNNGELECLIAEEKDIKPYQYTTMSELIADLVSVLKSHSYYVTHRLSKDKQSYFYDIYVKNLSGVEPNKYVKYPSKIAVRGAMRQNKKEEK